MDDRHIVELIFSRDQEGLAQAERKYGAGLRRMAAAILGDPGAAEECVNDGLMALWNRVPPHRPTFLGAFLAKIVRETSFNRFRHDRAAKRGGGAVPAALEELAELVSGLDSTESELEGRELTGEIDAFLASLPVSSRRMFVRRYFFADSVTDIARDLGMTPNRVSVTLNRLREGLRRHLTERGYEL